MRARIPLDVDLEDKLVYGLPAARLAALALGCLGALSLWSVAGLPVPVRSGAAVAVLAVAFALAYLRVAGRTIEGWIVDAVRYCHRNYRPAITSTNPVFRVRQALMDRLPKGQE